MADSYRNKLLLATGNKGKVAEYRSLLAGIPYDIVSMAEQGITIEVEETGSTFQENARLKATALAEASGLLTLADDSGLEVAALGGEPGVRSARYAGEGATDADRNAYLLDKLRNVPPEKRQARFRCVIAIAAPEGRVDYCTGDCPGVINTEPRGSHGFGYDPVFYLPEIDKTMAELTPEQKNELSHRAKAAEQARELLKTPDLHRGTQ